jgi:hypothetical protein
MAKECASCGCLMLQARVVVYEDCRATHDVCQTCAEELAPGVEGYDLVA